MFGTDKSRGSLQVDERLPTCKLTGGWKSVSARGSDLTGSALSNQGRFNLDRAHFSLGVTKILLKRAARPATWVEDSDEEISSCASRPATASSLRTRGPTRFVDISLTITREDGSLRVSRSHRLAMSTGLILREMEVSLSLLPNSPFSLGDLFEADLLRSDERRRFA